MQPLFELTRTLIDIESITGNEAGMMDFLEKVLQELGLQVQSQFIEPHRRNIFATTSCLPRVVLCTHVDTVPPFFASSEDASDIHGRGACDTKGIIAAMLHAAAVLLSQDIRDFGMLFLVGEEIDSIGAKNSNDLAGGVEYIIVGEPTGNRPGKGHKGLVSFELNAAGVACHSSFPEMGESAIDKLLDALALLRRADFGTDPELGGGSLNIGMISGGRAHNILADSAQAVVSIRATVPVAEIMARVREVIGEALDINIFIRSEPQKLHVPPGFEGVVLPFGTDIPHLKAWGKPLLLGPGDIRLAHTAEERISKHELQEAVARYQEVVRKLLA